MLRPTHAGEGGFKRHSCHVQPYLQTYFGLKQSFLQPRFYLPWRQLAELTMSNQGATAQKAHRSVFGEALLYINIVFPSPDALEILECYYHWP
jgi:hypothetical protein